VTGRTAPPNFQSATEEPAFFAVNAVMKPAAASRSSFRLFLNVAVVSASSTTAIGLVAGSTLTISRSVPSSLMTSAGAVTPVTGLPVFVLMTVTMICFS
jgi:hypothetical protein